MSSLFERGLGSNGLIQRYWDAAGQTDADGIIEEVTLRIRGTADTWTDILGVTAFRRILDKRDARVAAGMVAVGSTVFHLRASTMGGHEVRQFDAIRDANNVQYEINAAMLESAQSRWRCEVTKDTASG